MAVKVKVTWSSGKPVKGSKVVFAFYSLGRGNSKEVYTDSDGYANFYDLGTGEADVIVDGNTKLKRVQVEDGKTFSVTI